MSRKSHCAEKYEQCFYLSMSYSSVAVFLSTAACDGSHYSAVSLVFFFWAFFLTWQNVRRSTGGRLPTAQHIREPNKDATQNLVPWYDHLPHCSFYVCVYGKAVHAINTPALWDNSLFLITYNMLLIYWNTDGYSPTKICIHTLYNGNKNNHNDLYSIKIRKAYIITLNNGASEEHIYWFICHSITLTLVPSRLMIVSECCGFASLSAFTITVSLFDVRRHQLSFSNRGFSFNQ